MPSHAASGQPIKPHTQPSVFLYCSIPGVNTISIFWSSQNLTKSNTDRVHISFSSTTNSFLKSYWNFSSHLNGKKKRDSALFLHHCDASEVISNISLPSLKKKTGKKAPTAVLAFPLCHSVSGTMKMGRNQLYWRHAHSQRYLRLLLSLNLKIDLLQN